MSLSAKQKDALRKVANKYVTLAGQDHGLKQEVLEQFQKEVASCVATDESGSEIKDGNKSNKVMWYIIGGAALLVGGFIVYKLIRSWTKSPQDKIMGALREWVAIGRRVSSGEIEQAEADRLMMEARLTPDTIVPMFEQAHVTVSSRDAIIYTFEGMGRAIDDSHGTANVDGEFAKIQKILNKSCVSK